MYELVIYVLINYGDWQVRFKEARGEYSSYQACAVEADQINRNNSISDIAVCLGNNGRQRPSGGRVL